jgi:hypothetical protein
MSRFMGAIDTLVLTTIATGPIAVDRAVTFAGAQATADQKVLGVSKMAAVSGDAVAVTAIGVRDMISGGAIAAGADVVADANGNPVAADGDDLNPFGQALNTVAGAGARVSILLRPVSRVVVEGA